MIRVTRIFCPLFSNEVNSRAGGAHPWALRFRMIMQSVIILSRVAYEDPSYHCSQKEDRQILPSMENCGIWFIRISATGDFNSRSDIDVGVPFASDSQTSLFDLAQMQIELEGLFGHPVETLEKEGLRNPF
jgi:predicted nucleotidyltransferase